MEEINNGAEDEADEDARDLESLRVRLRSAPAGLTAYDTALRCIHISDLSARKGFGRRPEDVVGHTLCDIAPEVARTLEPLLRHVLETDEPLLNVELTSELPVAPGRRSHWCGNIYPLRNSAGNTIGVGALGTDVTEGKLGESERAELHVCQRSAEQRLAFLAEASQLLASSPEYQTILRRVAHLAVPVLGDWCTVHALEDGGIRLVGRAWAETTDSDETRALLRTYLRSGHDPPPAVAQVLRSGTSLLLPELMVVALRARGRTLGVLSFGGRSDRRYVPDDIALAEDLARRCAQAVDNARLHTQAERRLRELEALYRADEVLHQSLRLDDVLQALMGVAADILEADKSVVLLWDAKHQQLVVGAARGVGAESLPLMVFAPGEGIPGRVAAHGEPVVLEDFSADPRISPRLQTLARAEAMGSLVSVPIKASDEVLGVFNVIFTFPRAFDADDQRLVQALAQRAGMAIGNARLYEQAQQAIRAREEFLATTSHELRNPLGNIKGFVTSLLRSDVDWDEPTRHDFLGEIEREADRLEDLVDDLLHMARVENDAVGAGPRALTPPSALVAGGVAQVRHMLVGRNVWISVPDELPAVEVDAAQVEHVVANLVENAVKYTPADTPIHVYGRLVGDQVELNVEDHGAGIAAEDVERVFDKFFRGRVPHNRPGTGLGLAISRAIVQAQGGSIRAENRPSGGARFVVTLPLMKQRQEPALGGPGAPTRPAETSRARGPS